MQALGLNEKYIKKVGEMSHGPGCQRETNERSAWCGQRQIRPICGGIGRSEVTGEKWGNGEE